MVRPLLYLSFLLTFRFFLDFQRTPRQCFPPPFDFLRVKAQLPSQLSVGNFVFVVVDVLPRLSQGFRQVGDAPTIKMWLWFLVNSRFGRRQSEGLLAARALGVRAVLRASALNLPVPTASVDLVVTLDVLQHLPLDGGDVRALAEMARVLKPGGHLFVRTNGQSFPRAADDPVFQFHKYTARELRAKLQAAGFRVIRLARLNAMLGLAEIPRELRAKTIEHSYHGLLSRPNSRPRWQSDLKRAWLRLEGRVVRQGASWPLGRTIVALCGR